MILLVVEYSQGKVSKSTREMATAARAIGREGPITLLVLGSGVASVAEDAALFGDQVLVADKPELEQYDPEVWASAVAQAYTARESIPTSSAESTSCAVARIIEPKRVRLR